MLSRMFDAAYPPQAPYPGSAAVAGYIGGNALHVWTLDEWLRFAGLVQFPIWVGANRIAGTADGQAAVAAAHGLGWRPFSPNRRAIIVDMETQVNPAYLNAFGQVVWASGYQTFVYESLVAVKGNPVKDGIWLADYTDIAEIPAVANVLGCQYIADVPWDGTQVDLSVIDSAMLAHGGIGARAQPAG